MKKLKYSQLLLVSLLLIIYACGNEKGDQTIENTTDNLEADINESLDANEDGPLEDDLTTLETSYDGFYLITESSAGDFTVGTDLPEEGELGDYGISIVEEEYIGDEGPELITEWRVKEGADYTLKLSPDLWGDDDGKIGDIIVMDPKYRTAQNIGVGSTIEDFDAAYNDYEISYSYVSDRYMMDTPSLKRVQFILSGDDYKHGTPNFDSDHMVLDFEDFKEGAQIQSIRLF